MVSLVPTYEWPFHFGVGSCVPDMASGGGCEARSLDGIRRNGYLLGEYD